MLYTNLREHSNLNTIQVNYLTHIIFRSSRKELLLNMNRKNSDANAEKKRRVRKFSPKEDEQIINFYGNKKGVSVREFAKSLGRNSRSVRERYEKYLSCPKKSLNHEELRELIKYVKQFGSKWKLISKYFPGTSDCIVRDEYNKINGRKFRIRYPNLYNELINIQSFNSDFMALNDDEYLFDDILEENLDYISPDWNLDF